MLPRVMSIHYDFQRRLAPQCGHLAGVPPYIFLQDGQDDFFTSFFPSSFIAATTRTLTITPRIMY